MNDLIREVRLLRAGGLRHGHLPAELNIYACVGRRSVHRGSVYFDRSNLQLTSKSGQAISRPSSLTPQGNIVGLARRPWAKRAATRGLEPPAAPAAAGLHQAAERLCARSGGAG